MSGSLAQPVDEDTARHLKACCARAYASEAARWVLGERFHPGGAALTARLAAWLNVGSGSLIADVACGSGASAIQVARLTGCRVIGLDLSPDNVTSAQRTAAHAGLSGRVSFVVGDAEALPLDNASLDGALSECALCTFPDKPAAARELVRALRPGARLALADMTAEPARLPQQLRTLHAWVACVADARPLAGTAQLLEGVGLVVERQERHDSALSELLDRIQGRLLMGRLLQDGAPHAQREHLERGLELVAAAHEALADQSLGYGAVLARRPADHEAPHQRASAMRAPSAA